MRRFPHTRPSRLLPTLCGQRGVALILTLLVVALLTVIVVEFDFQTRLDVRAAANFRDDTKAYLLADSAIAAAKGLLLEDAKTSGLYDGYDELWGTPIANVPVADGAITVAISDEDGKLNLNGLAGTGNESEEKKRREIFERLLLDSLEVELEDARVMVDSLVDWIDPDLDEEVYGAEGRYYETLTPPYQIRDDKLRTFDELALVKGFDDEIMKLLEPHVTVIWKGPGKKMASWQINVNTASDELLLALHPDMEASWVDNIVAARPLNNATPASIQAAMITSNQVVASAIAKYLTHKSSHFRVSARAEVGDTARSVVATLARQTGADIRVIAWRSE